MKKDNKNKEKKENKTMRFLDIIKKKWLINGTSTILLIAILIAVFILLNSIIKSFDISPIDCTSNKEYSLTDTSKDKIKNISQAINVYLIGYDEEQDKATISLIKDYNKENSNISIEVIDANKRPDIIKKYNLSNDSYVIVVECGEKYKILYADDLYSYDESYNTIDLTEEKITSALLNVTSEKVPNVYFLSGYSDYSLGYDGAMGGLESYLKNEVLEYHDLDMVVKADIPEDCDTLVIMTPNKDFDELTTNKITEYINRGGKILWLNTSYAIDVNFPNVNKILALYGIDPFEKGYIYEDDDDKIAYQYASCIVEDIEETEIGKNLDRVVLLNSTKINCNEANLENLKVEKEDIIKTSEKSYFRKDVSNTSSLKDNDEKGGFTVGAKFVKTLSEDENNKENNITSTLIIFGDNNFVSDMQLSNQIPPMLNILNNKDVVLNSIAYLTDQKVDISIRKDSTKQSTFTATVAQEQRILIIIFAVPIAVIIAGIVVWQVRRRKK